jgi:glucose/arabinose dehydrogenase
MSPNRLRRPFRLSQRRPQARAPAETVAPHLPTGGSHRTRDVLSPDGRTMYVSVGSAQMSATLWES